MREFAWNAVALAAASVVLTGCGGGGGSDARCSDFRYQQDAQAAYEAGADQLDGDNDGIACESLPSRKSGGGTSTPVPVAPVDNYLPYAFVTGQGVTARLYPLQGKYGLEYTFIGGSGGNSGPFDLSSGFAGTFKVQQQDIDISWVNMVGETTPTWSPALLGQPASPGVSLSGKSTSTSVLSEVAGSYVLMGQRCAPSAPRDCKLVVATATVMNSSGRLRVCLGTNFSENCPDVVDRYLVPGPTNTWRLQTSPGGPVSYPTLGEQNLLFSKQRGTVAMVLRDERTLAGKDDTLTLFGHRVELTAADTQAFPQMASIYNVWGLITERPAAATWTVMANVPLAGFRRDPAGKTYLRSTTGQLVTWTPPTGPDLWLTPQSMLSILMTP